MAIDEERKRVVEEKNDLLWFLGSPVAICSVKLELDMSKNCMFAYSKMINVQPENIKAVIFDVICYDSVRKEVDRLEKAAYYELDIPRNGVFGMSNPVRIRNNATRNIEFVLVSVTTVAGDTWNNSEGKRFDIDLEQKSIINVQGDLNKDFINNCTKANIDHTKLILEPVFKEEYWMCACGTLNWNDEKECCGCGVNKDWLIRNTSKENLMVQAQYRISETRRIREEAQAREQQDNIVQTEEFERRKASYQQQQKTEQHKNNRKKFITGAVIVAIIAAAAALFCLFGLPLVRYGLAVIDLNSRQYDSAISRFEQMDGYLDSEELIKQAKYEKAMSEMSSGKSESALELFSQVSGYKDADAKYIEAAFDAGKKRYEAGNYLGASEMFNIVMAGSDQEKADAAAEMNKDCLQHIYEDAQALLSKKDYEAAKESFEYLQDYKDSEFQARLCTYRIAGLTYRRREYDKAIEIYESLRGYSDVDEILAGLETLRKVTSAAAADGSPAVWNGYNIKDAKTGSKVNYVFEFYLDGKYNFAVLSSSGEELENLSGSYKIEKNIIYTMYYDKGSEAWEPLSNIESMNSSSEVEGKNTEMVITDPFKNSNTVKLYGNIISDDNVSM